MVILWISKWKLGWGFVSGEISQGHTVPRDFPCGSDGKESACNAETQFDPWVGILEKEMTTHSSILAWRIPWTEELAGYSQSMESQRVRHNQVTDMITFTSHSSNGQGQRLRPQLSDSITYLSHNGSIVPHLPIYYNV